jgi:hypothetical protein
MGNAFEIRIQQPIAIARQDAGVEDSLPTGGGAGPVDAGLPGGVTAPPGSGPDSSVAPVQSATGSSTNSLLQRLLLKQFVRVPTALQSLPVSAARPPSEIAVSRTL